MVHIKVQFINHLPIGTASFYRQIGIGRILKEKGHSVSYIFRSKQISGGGDGKDKDDISDLDVSYWKEPFELLPVVNSLMVVGKCRKTDVIFLNRANPFSATSTIIGNIFTRKPIVIDMEDWDGYGGYSSMAPIKFSGKLAMSLFEEFVPRKSKCVLGVSKFLCKRAIAMGFSEDRVFYAPNGADTNFFNPGIDGLDVRKLHNIEPDESVVVLLGILYGFETNVWKMVVDIILHTVEQDPNIKILLIGWGDELKNIRRQIEDLGIAGNVIFTGRLKRDDVPKYIAAGDVALHILDNGYFYCYNQSPNTLSEFLAMGKPIVATDIGEIHQALKGGVGILIDGMDPVDYANAIVKLTRDKELIANYSKAARKRATERYSMEILAKKVEEACMKAFNSK